MIPDDFQTENLTLRPFASEDGPAVYAYWKSDPGWEKFNESVPSGFTEDDAEKFVAEMRRRDRADQPNWALVYDSKVVGVVSLSFEKERVSASVGYGIHARLRGRGLCAEAVEQVLEQAFRGYPELDAVHALTDARNSASIRVLKKLGFSEFADSREGDSSYRLSRADWAARNQDS